MKVKNDLLFFTKYTIKGPSSRYRSYQYKFYLADYFNLDFYPLFNDEYIENLYNNKRKNYFSIFRSYINRIYDVLRILGTNKIVFIEYELLPYFPSFLEYLLYKTNVKFILDYDDAIFHNYDLHKKAFIRFLFKNKIPSIVSYSNLVISGSPYLTSYFNKYSSKVFEIPTSIILSKYSNFSQGYINNNKISIGWIGSKSTSINVIYLKDVIRKIYDFDPNVIFKFMGFDSSLRHHISFPNVEFYDWSESNELDFLNNIHLGIMPLEDTSSNQGKCGFKLIQYMAMGKPTLSSPLMANVKINRDNFNLFAIDNDDWYIEIKKFLKDISFYNSVGLKNQDIVARFYSVEGNSLKYIHLLNELANVRY
jgi:hypothetical protein